MSDRALAELEVRRLGRMGYRECLALQERLVAARKVDEAPDTLLLVEHDAVVTMGRAADEGNLRLGRGLLSARGIDVFDIGRGGDATYHGPGQLVGYPIVKLTPDRADVRKYVSSLEETMIRMAASYDIEAERIDKLNGTWVRAMCKRDAELVPEGDRKIGAVGVRISRWVTMHGFAFNGTTDLSHFDLIVPCGIHDKGVTTVEAETGHRPSYEELCERATREFAGLYDSSVTVVDGAPD